MGEPGWMNLEMELAFAVLDVHLASDGSRENVCLVYEAYMVARDSQDWNERNPGMDDDAQVRDTVRRSMLFMRAIRYRRHILRRICCSSELTQYSFRTALRPPALLRILRTQYCTVLFGR